jgi:putative oxidoreductase
MEWTHIALLAGRILLGGYFLLAGINHIRQRTAMAGYAASKGVPAPMAAVLGTGGLLLLGGASILLGLHPIVGLAVLAIFLVGVTPSMHAFWKVRDPMHRMGEQINFMKNTALLGALLALAALPQPWPLAA